MMVSCTLLLVFPSLGGCERSLCVSLVPWRADPDCDEEFEELPVCAKHPVTDRIATSNSANLRMEPPKSFDGLLPSQAIVGRRRAKPAEPLSLNPRVAK